MSAQRSRSADRRMGFVLALRRSGATDLRALAALERLDRGAFAPAAYRALASYGDLALPLGGGQTMTRPSVIARVLEALAVTPRCRVLEIGAGSGYQTAALAALAGEVVALERVGGLAEDAGARLAGLAMVRHADGLEAPPVGAFDRIVVNAALPAAPAALLQRLAPEGVLIAPVLANGSADPEDPAEMRFRRGGQDLRLWRRQGDEMIEDSLGPVRFSPAAAGLA